MKKKIKQFFCRHTWIIVPNEETDRFVAQCELDIREGKPVSYAYSQEHKCKKCGKVISLGSGMIY